MTDIYVKRSELLRYKQDLLHERDRLIELSNKIKSDLNRLQWSDTIREDIIKVLNENFIQYNKIISAITRACKQIDKLVHHLDAYFRSII